MPRFFIQVIFLGIVAAIRPIVTPVLLAVLAGKHHARARGLGLLAGVAGGVLVLSAVASLLADAAPAIEFTRDVSNLIRIAAVFGLLLALFGAALLVLRPKFVVPERFTQTLETVDSPRRLGAFAAFGLFKTVFNSRMILLALALASLLTLLPPRSSADTLALLLFFALSLTLLGTIMAYYLLRREAAEAQLAELSRWTLAHSTQIAGVVSLVMGALIFFSCLPLPR